MIRHVVILTLSGDTVEAKKAAFGPLKRDLEALHGVVPGLMSMEVNFSTGPNPQNWDMCLISEHESWDALRVYEEHPAHLEVVDKVFQHATARAGADFEI